MCCRVAVRCRNRSDCVGDKTTYFAIDHHAVLFGQLRAKRTYVADLGD